MKQASKMKRLKFLEVKPMPNKSMFIILVTVLFYNLLERDVCAYIDPGTGSYIFQIVLALLVTVPFVIKSFWSKIKTFIAEVFSKREKKE